MIPLLTPAAILWTLCAVSVEAPVVVKDFRVPAVASPPFTYCIWYLPDPETGSFFEDVAASPPDLFHIGFHIPFKGHLGPTYGHDLFSNEILPPDAVPREVERVERIVAKIRQAGVATFIPYVYTMAFFGRPDERSGFFNFYDHWEDYRSFGLGPKPAADPTLWSQVRGPMQLGGGPPGILHFEPCVNHPGWSDYLDLVVRQLASVGYDGMFFDVNTQYCHCPHCEEKFDIYLLERYGRNGLRKYLGTDDHRFLNLAPVYRDFEQVVLDGFPEYLKRQWEPQGLAPIVNVESPEALALEEDWRLLRCYMQDSVVEFPPTANFEEYLRRRFGATNAIAVAEPRRGEFVQTMLRRQFRAYLESEELAGVLHDRFGSADVRRRCCATPRDLLLWVETQQFWCNSIAAMFARLKEAGRKTLREQDRDADFFTVGNLGAMATVDALNKRRVNGINLVQWAPTADLMMFEEMQQPGVLDFGVILSNALAFRWAMGAGTRAGTLLYKVIDDVAADLAHAEAAAAGGGAFIQAALNAPESRRRWKQFFSEHADLWRGGVSRARVALLFWANQVFYEFPEHLAVVHRLSRVFAETQIPYDIVTETDTRDLSDYDVVFAPALRYVSGEQLARLIGYADAGGRLVTIDPFGTEGIHAQPRTTPPLDELRVPLGFQATSYGKGVILRLADSEAPARKSDFWPLMEERANDFARAREYLVAARQEDLEKGVDLGAAFVARLEETLDLRLRWCAPDTPPSVYLHPYQVPGKDGVPQRLVVHLVNYDTPIVLEEPVPEATDATWTARTRAADPVAAVNVSITVPLRDDFHVSAIEAFSPVEDAGALSFFPVEGGVTVTVPRLRTYQALVVSPT